MALGAVLIFAFCTGALPNSISRINNPVLKDYTYRELERGAPSLPIPSKVLYREALGLLDQGKWEMARQKLQLAASLSGDYPDPMLTLARVELVHGHPDFLFHFIEGLKRLKGNFHSQSLLAANGAILLVTSTLGALLLTLVVLLIKYWPLLGHKLSEAYSKRFSFPPERWIGILILISLMIMRLGLALYTVILLLVLWSYMNKKEKGVTVTLAAIISLCSFLAPYSNTFLPSLDPGSVTRRLSSINERGAEEGMIKLISEIDEPGFLAERDYALGTLMYRLGDLEEAKGYLLRSVSRREDFAPAFLNLGNVYFKQGDFDKALAGYQNVIALDSENVLAYYNIGQTYIKKMLFAESSSALKKAGELGIENHRSVHPATQIRNLTIYEEGFGTSNLWSIALREGKKREGVALSEILMIYLLFPFHRLGILLIASIVAAVIISRTIPQEWKAFRCDNCGKATCPECADTETGITLCRDCSSVIRGLTSVKVMEALLRHRRHKVSKGPSGRTRCRALILPCAAYILHGKVLRGTIIASINIGMVMLLFWRGFYFKDPYVLNITFPLWKIIVPLAVLAIGYIISLRVKTPQEPRNYRILPPEFQIEKEQTGRSGSRPEFEPNENLVGTFLDSI